MAVTPKSTMKSIMRSYWRASEPIGIAMTSIAIAVHQNIAWAHARHPQFTSIEVGPVIDIPFGCKDRDALTGCTTRCMNLDGATRTSRLHKGHPVGICSTHCLLFEKWQLLDIFQRLNV